MRVIPTFDAGTVEVARRAGRAPFRRLTRIVVAALAVSVATAATAQVGSGGFVFFGDRSVRESIPSSAPIVQFAAGYYHVVALRADGTVVAWGLNRGGECRVPGVIANARQVAAGSNHSLVLLADGTVRAFGLDDDGQCDVPAGLANVVEVACGDKFSMALRSDGTVVCWGDGTGGTLLVPTGLDHVVQIAGGNHHCLALKSDGTVIGWGANGYGQASIPASAIGVASIAAHGEQSGAVLTNGKVVLWGNSFNAAGPPTGLSGVVQLALSAGNGVALKSDGTLVCWGSSSFGQTTPPPTTAKFTRVEANYQACFGLTQDGAVLGWGDGQYGHTLAPSGFLNYHTVSAGATHVGLLRNDGSLFAWGNSRDGQCSIPTSPGVKYQSFECGRYYSAALSTNNGMVLFGDNAAGQCSIPSTLAAATKLWAAGRTTFARRYGGGLSAWGNGQDGEFGLTNALQDAQQIVGGDNHALALKLDGTVIGAGEDSYGQLDIPAGLSQVTQIASTANHALARRADGTIAAWGWNSDGQATVPPLLTHVMQVAAGLRHSAALLSDGSVVAWGANYAGQATIPGELRGVAQIAAGDDFTVCAPKVQLDVTPYKVFGGDHAKGMVFIPSPAPAGGAVVNLASSWQVASVPPSVTIPAGQTSATFDISTVGYYGATQAVITATLGSLTQRSLLTIVPHAVSIVTDRASVVGGSTSNLVGTITLSAPAPVGGATVTLASSSPSAAVPAQVTVPAGQTVATFTIDHKLVSSPTPDTIAATYQGETRSTSITVLPFQIASFEVNPSSVIGGSVAVASIGLNATPKANLTMSLSSSNPTLVPAPGTVTLPAGQSNDAVSLFTNRSSSDTAVTLTGNLNGTRTATLNLIRFIASAQFDANPWYGASKTTCTVTLSAPAKASGEMLVLAPDSHCSTVYAVTVPGGQTSVTFDVKAYSVTSNTLASLTVMPGTGQVTVSKTVLPNTLASFTITPTTFKEASTTAVNAAVTLQAPVEYDTIVYLSSGNTLLVQTPSILVSKGSKTGSAIVGHGGRVSQTTLVAVKATTAGASKSIVLTLTP